MTAAQGSCLRRCPVRTNSGKGLMEVIQHAEWTWLGGRLDNESKRESGVKHHSKSRNLTLVSYRERETNTRESMRRRKRRRHFK